MNHKKLMEEALREAACFGDIETLKELILKGVNINSKNDMNGWTALHWAAHRNNIEAVSTLLNNGADKTSLTNGGYLPCNLTSSDKILALIGGNVSDTKQPSLSITPNYLRSPPFFYSVNSSSKKDSVSFSEVNSKEVLVLKIRVAESSESDFIEIELLRSELTFENLKKVCSEELEIEPYTICKIRKIPNTIIRNNKDVQRLTDFQELEIFLLKPVILPSS